MRNDKVKVVQYGCGKMSKVIMKYLLNKGALIVGAIDSNPELVGKDIGDFANLGFKTGVLISDNADEAFKNVDADIAIVTIASFVKDMVEHLETPLRHGVNVITISEEALYPWTTSASETNRLDKIAKDNNATIIGTGMQDVYWVQFPTLMLAGINNVTKIKGEVSYNVDHYGLALANAHGVDFDLDKFKSEITDSNKAPAYSWMVAEAICSKLNMTVKSLSQEYVPITLNEDIFSKTLGKTIKAGNAIGMSGIVTIETFQGPTIEVGCTGKVYKEGEGDLCTWDVVGTPNISFSVNNPDTVAHTCATIVNRIPSVINSKPGYVSIDKAMEVEYLTYPIDMYINRTKY